MPTKAQEKLAAAIKGLYSSFPAGLKPGFETRVSDLDGGYRRKLALGLRQRERQALPPHDLQIYAYKSRFTMGDSEDFRYFLPRMLELYSGEAEWHRNTAQSLLEIVRGHNLSSWSPAERRALEAYLSALWPVVLACYPWFEPVAEVVVPAAEIVGDPGRFLDGWLTTDSVPALRHLAEFASDPALLGDPSFGPWLRSPGPRESLENAYFRHCAEPFSEDLARAADVLRQCAG